MSISTRAGYNRGTELVFGSVSSSVANSLSSSVQSSSTCTNLLGSTVPQPIIVATMKPGARSKPIPVHITARAVPGVLLACACAPLLIVGIGLCADSDESPIRMLVNAMGSCRLRVNYKSTLNLCDALKWAHSRSARA